MTDPLPPEPTDDLVDEDTPRTMICPVRAEAVVDLSLSERTSVVPAPLNFPQHYAQLVLDPYLVFDGSVFARPELGVEVQTKVGIGTYDFNDLRLDPLEVDTEATLRWLPSMETFTESDSWRPTIGPGDLWWVAEGGSSPYLDNGYSYQVDGDETDRPAIVFDDGAWLELSSRGYATNAFTIGIVAVLGPGHGDGYSIVESVNPHLPDDGSAGETNPLLFNEPTQFGVRYRHGTLEVWAGSTVVAHTSMAPQGTPTILVLSMDTDTGRLAVVDHNRSSRSFNLRGVRSFDADLYLGRSDSNDESTTAVMDVLEVNFFDRALSFHEIEGFLADMSAVYGVRP